MPNLEQFNSYDEKYKKVADLPEDQQQNFADVEGGGFAKKEAEQKYQDAKCLAEFINSMRYDYIAKIAKEAKKTWFNEEDYQMNEQEFLKAVDDALKLRITAIDILHKEGIEDDSSTERTITDKAEFLKGDYRLEQASEELRADRDVVMKSLKKWPHDALQFASEELRDDKEIVMAALEESANQFIFASESIRGDKEVILSMIENMHWGCNSEILKYVSEEMRDDKEVAIAALNGAHRAWANFCFLSERLRSDKEIVMMAMEKAHNNSGKLILYTPEEMRSDKDVVMKSILNGNTKLEGVSGQLKNDPEFVMEAIKNLNNSSSTHNFSTGSLYESLPDNLKGDKRIILEALNYNTKEITGSIFYNIPTESLKDKEIAFEVLKAIKWDNHLAENLPEELAGDEDFILSALEHNTDALKYTSKALKADREFMLKAIQITDGEALRWAVDELKNDYDFVSYAFRANPKSLKYVSKEIREKIRDYMPYVSRTTFGKKLSHFEDKSYDFMDFDEIVKYLS